MTNQTLAADQASPKITSPKITVLHGTNYWNMGDLALMISMVQSLQRHLHQPEITILTQFSARVKPPDQDFHVSDLGVREFPWMTVRRGSNKLINGLMNTSVFMMYVPLILLARMTRGYGLRLLSSSIAKPIKSLIESDLIVSKPGGFLYSYRRFGIQHQTVHLILAVLSGRPIVIYGQSIGPYSKNTDMRVVAWALRQAKLLLVRDEPSVEVCKQMGLSHFKLTADEAFLLQSVQPKDVPEFVNASNGLVGITILEWSFPGQPASTRDKYINAYAEFVSRLVDRGFTIVLFPFVLSDSITAGDERITTELAEQLSSPQVVTYRCDDPRHYMWSISKCDAFVGSRMHSNILALGCHVPVLAVAYQPKTMGIMKMAGLQDFVIDINNITSVELQECFDRLWNDRQMLRARLVENIAKIRQAADMNAHCCAELINGQSQVCRQQVAGLPVGP